MCDHENKTAENVADSFEEPISFAELIRRVMEESYLREGKTPPSWRQLQFFVGLGDGRIRVGTDEKRRRVRKEKAWCVRRLESLTGRSGTFPTRR